MDSLKKVVLIDGDQSLGGFIQTALVPQKFKVVTASTCASGIQKVIQHHPDLILYNTNLAPLDGSEVLKALQLTSAFSHIPVVFYKDKNEQEIQSILNGNGNEILLKSKHPKNFHHFHEIRFEENRNEGNGIAYDFNSIFNLLPYGMFILSKNIILSTNQMMLNLLKRHEHDLTMVKLENIFEKSSVQAIKVWRKKYSNGDNSSFNDQVTFKDKAGEQLTMNLMIFELQKVNDSVHFLGVFQAVQGNNVIVNYQLANEVCNLLKRENIALSEALEKKITQTIKQRTIIDTTQKKSFFTKREDEVLRLSMEGLSIKVIADKLSLSTRTVEKYRTKLMVKSGAKNIVEVIVFSVKNNLVKI